MGRKNRCVHHDLKRSPGMHKRKRPKNSKFIRFKKRCDREEAKLILAVNRERKKKIIISP